MLAPSPVREAAHRAFPKALEDWDIKLHRRRLRRSGATHGSRRPDGIELDAYGHLPDQFWSPATNQRDDGDNGSIDNRLRFIRQVLTAIRTATDPRFIAYKCALVADEDLADRPVARGGRGDRAPSGGRRRSGFPQRYPWPHGHRRGPDPCDPDHEVRVLRRIWISRFYEVRAATRIPVFHAARIQDIATARHAIVSGKLDMVGMTWAHIAEPHIVKLLTEGRETEIRPCVGATYCLDRIYEGNDAVCVHNPATGREATMPQWLIARDAAPARKVVVVGAGPAGLEAACVARHVAIGWRCSRRRISPAGRFCWRAGWHDGRSSGDRRLAMERLAAMGVTPTSASHADADDVLAQSPGPGDPGNRRRAEYRRVD